LATKKNKKNFGLGVRPKWATLPPKSLQSCRQCCCFERLRTANAAWNYCVELSNFYTQPLVVTFADTCFVNRAPTTKLSRL